MTDPQTLTLEEVRIALAGKTLVEVDAHIAPGEVLTVMGPSGAGKSTLLALVAGFLSPAFHASGRVLLNALDLTGLPAEQRGIGLLFQDPLLFPHLSVAGNLHFGLPRATRAQASRAHARRAHARQARAAQVEQALAEVGLAGFGDRDPATLSGGQQSRVALMRLLLSAPRAVLLDEPFAKLDSHLRREIRQLVFDRLREAGLPSLLVTHDRDDAAAAGGRVITL